MVVSDWSGASLLLAQLRSKLARYPGTAGLIRRSSPRFTHSSPHILDENYPFQLPSPYTSGIIEKRDVVGSGHRK
jgi:hypothetical protein